MYVHFVGESIVDRLKRLEEVSVCTCILVDLYRATYTGRYCRYTSQDIPTVGTPT